MTKIKNGSVVNDSENKLVLYTDKHGGVELRADVKEDTIWATQAQIAQVFDTTIPNINIHLKSIYREGELKVKSTIKESLIVLENRRKYLTKLYNLDAIIAVGYRVNSKKATKFRIWATKILHDYLVKGYALNERTISRSADNVENLQKALAFMGSQNISGALKGKIVLRVSKEVKG